MSVATIDRPAVNTAEMGVTEAKAITLAIKDNFDSLGSMLLQARDRKAYKALGYRSFDTYCKTEFGKSISHAYQLIEDVKVVAELEAEISKQYDEPVTLKFPSSHLRPLKEIPGVGDKLKAIEYAQKLAKAEGKTPTKKHLELAVFQISGHRPEDFKSAIESLGFTKGTQVEVTKNLKQDRGFVTKVDKKGKIYVELHTGGVVPIPYDAADLRILGDVEKPAIPANDETANKGDKVKIFAKGREGQTGEVFTWQMGKHAMVKITGEQVPVNIAYAELELIKEETITVKNANQWGDSDWTFNNNNYYYFEKENKIVSSSWPTGLTLEPYSQRFDSPSEFMKQWEERFKPDLIRALTGDSDTTSVSELKALRTENQRLREQLAEAESVIEAIVGMAHEQIEILPEVEQTALRDSTTKAVSISFAKTIDELLDGKKTQTRRLWQEAYAGSFIRYFEEDIAIPALNKGRHRGGHELGHIKLTQRPYQQLLSEMSAQDLLEEGGMAASVQEFIDGFFEGQDELVWVLHFEFEKSVICENTAEFLVENTSDNSSPGDTAAHTEFLVEDAASIAPPLGAEQTTEFLVEDAASIAPPLGVEQITEFFPQEIIDRVAIEREKIFQAIEDIEIKKAEKLNKQRADRIKKDLEALRNRLEGLKKFEQLKIGQIVWRKNNPERAGVITGFTFTTGGMPHIFVRWNSEDENPSIISPEIVSSISISQPEL